MNRHVPVTAGDIAQSSSADQRQESMDVDFLADMETMAVMAVMGADSKSYRREHRRAARMVLSEIYSPPRVTKILSGMPGHALAPGVALDLTCTDPYGGLPWDFDKPEKRQRAHPLSRTEADGADWLSHVHGMVHLATFEQAQT